MSGAPVVSVLVPVRERPEPLAELYEEYARPLREAGLRYEFVAVCEPWFAGLAAPLAELARSGEPIVVLHVGQAVGEATMLKIAAERAKGDVLITLPAYRRVHGPALVELVSALRHADLALAVRWPRKDSWINRLQNKAFHALVRALAKSSFRDLACGVRAMRRVVMEDTPMYGDIFRFFPLLAQREGFRVVEIEAAQHAGDDQPRVYAPGTYLRRAIDLLGMFFLLRFTDKPLRFFGLLGSLTSLAGVVVLGVVWVQRLGGEPLADRPVLLLGVLLVVLGAQAIALGLVGEMIVFHHAHQRRRYRLADHRPDFAGPLPRARETSGTHPGNPAQNEKETAETGPDEPEPGGKPSGTEPSERPRGSTAEAGT